MIYVLKRCFDFLLEDRVSREEQESRRDVRKLMYLLFFYSNGFKQRLWRYRSKCGLGMYFGNILNKTRAWIGDRHDRGITFDFYLLF